MTKKAEQWLKKNAAPIRKSIPGIKRYAGRETIKLAPVPKYRVQKQFTANNGAQVTVIRPPGRKEKTGRTWLIRESPHKGNFIQTFDVKADFRENTKVAFFIARDPEKEKAVALQVWRNFGEKATSVTEIDLGQYDAMARSRQTTFKNMGRASGFLAKRYGITFKFKLEQREGGEI